VSRNAVGWFAAGVVVTVLIAVVASQFASSSPDDLELLSALEVCERSPIIDGGKIVADGSTREELGDSELLSKHRLALPAGLRIEDFEAR